MASALADAPPLIKQQDPAALTSTLLRLDEEPVVAALPAIQLQLDDKHDWVQLTSGEILKGEVKHLYDDTLEFDSDILDTLLLDWDDIKVLQTAKPFSIGIQGVVPSGYGYFIKRLNTTQTYTGRLLVTGNTVTIDGQEFRRENLLTIIPDSDGEFDYWSIKVTLGATYRSGNTNQIDYSALANIRRRNTENRFILDYVGNQTEVDHQETVNNHRLSSSFDIFLDNDLFLRPIFAEYYRDPFQNIDYRLSAGTGLGVTIIDTSRTDWEISGGPGYSRTRFIEVEDGKNQETSTPALILETVYEYDFSDDIEFNLNYKIQYMDQEAGGYTHHALTGLSFEVTDILDIDFSLIWDRIENPQPNSDGSVPKQDDIRFVVGLGLDI